MLSKSIILASASPRRHEILTLAGIDHRIITSDADEGSVPFTVGKPGEYTIATASLKNDAVYAEVKGNDEHKNSLIVSADTIVYMDNAPSPLGKPKSRDDAIRMLTELSGNSHSVVTGVVIRDVMTGAKSEFSVSTRVYFRELSEEEIIRYVDSGDPMDKAGAYGIQGGACSFVERLDGDYFNVVGLPICALVQEIAKY
ncbi:MAG: septum formation protein Maf [Clostridia bacterium]|nr:septum formation protein Maf [Clostridia bacterium]